MSTLRFSLNASHVTLSMLPLDHRTLVLVLAIYCMQIGHGENPYPSSPVVRT